MHSRVVRRLAGLLIAVSACTASIAETRQLQARNIGISWDSQQLPDSSWSVISTSLGPNLYLLPNGWTITDAWHPVFRFNATTDVAALHALDLHLDFGPPLLTRLPDGNYFRISTHPEQAYVSSVSLLTAPATAQLTISSGQNYLELTAGGSEHASASAGPLQATTAGLTSLLEVHAPASAWATAPQGSGGWDLTVSETLVGSYHLAPSADPACESLACMAGQRATATLQRIDLVIPTTYEFVYASNVPEPQPWALLLFGGLATCLRLRQRRGH